MPCNALLLLTGIPVITGLLCLILPDKMKLISRLAAFIVTLVSLAGSIYVFIHKPMSWQSGADIRMIADNLSAFIAVGIAVFAFLVTVYSIGYIQRGFGRYFGYVLITLGSGFAVAFANEFMTLLIGWGVLAVMLFLLVNLEGTEGATRSARKALIIIGGTDALMLFGVTLIWAMSGTFYMDHIRLSLSGMFPVIAYISVMMAALAKAGAMPFHSWLPDVAEDGPTPVTAYLPASLDKFLGIYLLARLSLNLFEMNWISNTALLFLGSATIILAVIFAMVQHDLKRLLGYHAVSQVGYMVLGIGTASPIGIAGALFHMLNNAIYKSCLFLSAGNVEKAAGTTDLNRLGGLGRYMPITFASFLAASLSISGIPPFNGFVSKWMIYQGIIESSSAKNPAWIAWLVAAMFGSALTIASFMKLLHAVFLGRRSAEPKEVKEAGVLMWLPAAALAFTCVIFGVFAFKLPLPVFILPSLGIPVLYLGTWQPIVATVLVISGLAVGILAYIVFSRKSPMRTVASFVGGEEQETLDRVSGTEFYDTVKDLKTLGALYRKEESGSLDIYNISRNTVYFFTRILQKLHNGILPTYMVWCLLGMVVMFLLVFFR